MLEMKDISYTYKGKGNRQILTDINMTFEEGKFYVIVGTSGSGKTTLLSLLAGLDEPQSGQIQHLAARWQAMPPSFLQMSRQVIWTVKQQTILFVY